MVELLLQQLPFMVTLKIQNQLVLTTKLWLEDFKKMEEKMIDVVAFGMDMNYR